MVPLWISVAGMSGFMFWIESQESTAGKVRRSLFLLFTNKKYNFSCFGHFYGL